MLRNSHGIVFSETNPEAMWDVWKNLFMDVVEKNAPLQNKRVSKKHFPWITHHGTENNTTAWERFKQARNEVNNAIKSAKKQYFMHNLEMNKKNVDAA